ncbi:MAG: hypothetical protein Q9177_006117 [Variospora cf. flavescens]
MNELVAQIQSELLSLLPWLGIPAPLKAEETATTRNGQEKQQQVRLLDYACGAGEVSKSTRGETLLPSVDAALGIDISPGMVKAYNERAAEAGIKGEEMRAVRGDFSSSSSFPVATTNNNGDEETTFSGEEWWGFDVAVMSMALHHVASPSDAVKALVDRLRKGGKVVVVDWWLDSIVFHDDGKKGAGHHAHQHHHHGHGHHQHHCGGEAEKVAGHAHNVVPGSEHTITRAGFGKGEMETMFKEAGCEGVEFRVFREETRLGDGGDAVMQRMFIIRGTKA